MCGIAGAFGLPVSQEILNSMCATMVRRGPDATGILQFEDCSMLHTRLAIIDPEGGHQPMELSRAGERYILVYNGELYNTEEVRKELVGLGHRFEGHSDTEVVLHAYVEWESGCLERFNGIFAFGVLECRRKRLFLARDRIGVKPLFYKLNQRGLLFASEIKTILAYPKVRAELNCEGAIELLLLGPGRKPGSGVFRGVCEIKPGYYGWYENGHLELKQYWRLRDRDHRENFEQTVEHVRYLVVDAIKRQMVSDVPIGTFLSGGLDSSIITAVCAGEMQKRGERLKTFSVDYADNDLYFVPGKFQPNSDGHYIRTMQASLGTDHHWCVLTPEDLLGELENATAARDLPGMADVDFSLLAFCREIRGHVKVALSGECADEIFGGYPWYRDPEIRAKEGFPWAQNINQRANLLSDWIRNSVCAHEYVLDQYMDTCHNSDILPSTSDQERRMKEMVNLNFNWFMQTLLDRKDRMSMYSGLEVRVPFCDYRIAEYLYGVPWEFKDYQGYEKGLLRCAVRDLLPDEILWRKKSPYPKTHDPRYASLVEEQLRTLMKSADAPLFSLVSKERVGNILNEEHPWPWYGQLMRRPQTIAYLLQINTWLRKYNVELVN